MLGKVLPFLVVGGVQVLVVLTGRQIPVQCAVRRVADTLADQHPDLCSGACAAGLRILDAGATQMQAMQLTFFFFLPSLLLSGFMFPYRGMPAWAQMLGEIFPLTHFLRIIRAVMLKGADLQGVAAPLAALVLFVAAFVGLALMRFRRTLD